MALNKIVVDCAKGTVAYLPLSAAEIAQQDQMTAAAVELENNIVSEEKSTEL